MPSLNIEAIQMNIWDWEFFESEISNGHYSVADAGPLYGPISDFTLVRNKDLDLILQTTSDGDSATKFVARRVGEVYTPSDKVELKSILGARATLSGVTPLKRNVKHSRMGERSISVQDALVDSIHWRVVGDSEPFYLIEWVGNLASSFFWPDSSDVTESGEKVFGFAAASSGVSISFPLDSQELSNCCVFLTVAGIELIIGRSRAKPTHVSAPGFILYKSVPDETTRRKIRDCLSFCLGDFLLYVGETLFNEKWRPVSFKASCGHALVTDSPKLQAHQPAPLGKNYEREIDARMLGEMVTRLFTIYDKYQLRSSFWTYWHAIAAPMHMAAVHFGSGIEGLQNRYLKQADAATNTKLVEDGELWMELSQKISLFIAEADIPEEAKVILINKAIHLNSAPQKVVMERFLKALNLRVGRLELDVWSNRNRAAHGSTSAENPGQLIRENKVLRILMNRILFSLSGIDFGYYDYYSYDRPLRRLAEAIIDDRPRKLR